jgi:hypothetical protein
MTLALEGVKANRREPKCCGNIMVQQMEQHAFKNVNNCLYTNIYSYLETTGGQSSNLYLNCCSFFQHQC